MTETKKGKIYKIITHLGDDIYIGSTSQALLCKRFQNHCNDYHRFKNGKRNKTTAFDLFDTYGIENCKIILIEEIDYTNKEQLRQREQYWIDNTNCVNKCKAFTGISGENYYRQYYEVYKDKIAEQQKQYREANKDKIAEYREAKLEQQKQYYEANKDKIAEQQKQYYEANKDKKAERNRIYYLKKKAEREQASSSTQ